MQKVPAVLLDNGSTMIRIIFFEYAHVQNDLALENTVGDGNETK